MGFSARSVNSSSAVDAPQFLLATCEKLSMPINSFSQLAGSFRCPSIPSRNLREPFDGHRRRFRHLSKPDYHCSVVCSSLSVIDVWSNCWRYCRRTTSTEGFSYLRFIFTLFSFIAVSSSFYLMMNFFPFFT